MARPHSSKMAGELSDSFADMIPFIDDLKRAWTQKLVTMIFERGGYTVVPRGIEEQHPELKHLTYEEYHQRNPSWRDRCSPDLRVMENGGAAMEVEVKYRTVFDDETSGNIYSELSGIRDPRMARNPVDSTREVPALQVGHPIGRFSLATS